MSYLLFAFLLFHGHFAYPGVFSQLGIDGVPVRWEAANIALDVSRPTREVRHMSHDQFVALVKESASIFNGPLGIRLKVRKLQHTIVSSQEDGVNEVAIIQYRKCRDTKDILNRDNCNDENRFARTRVYPAIKKVGQQFRKIVEGDIEINAGDFNRLNTVPEQQKLIAVLRHEIGHLLGLAHNCVESRSATQTYPDNHRPPPCDHHDGSQMTALMYPYSSHGVMPASEPSVEEWAYLKNLYPLPIRNSAIPFGVSIGIGLLFVVVLVVVILQIRYCRQMRRSNGQ